MSEWMMRAGVERSEVERFEAGKVAADEVKGGGREIAVELKLSIVVRDNTGGLLSGGRVEVWRIVSRWNAGGPIDVGADEGMSDTYAGEAN